MTRAFVCGNGISRRPVDLNQLQQLGKIYGCNGLYRDFEPDCLVATDRPIAETIQNSGYSQKHKFYTRKPLPGLGALPVPKKYHSNSSGPIATAMAALDGYRTLYLLGFDMGPTINAQIFTNHRTLHLHTQAIGSNNCAQLLKISHKQPLCVCVEQPQQIYENYKCFTISCTCPCRCSWIVWQPAKISRICPVSV